MKRYLLGAVILGVIGGVHTVEAEPIVYMSYEKVELKPVLIRAELPTERIERKIRAMFPEEPGMVKVAWCESRLEPNATNHNNNGSVDKGVFQLNSIHNFEGDLYNEDVNIAHARTLYEESGVQPWSFSFKCHGVK